MKREFSAFRPDLVLTYGDSPGVLATALIAHDQRVPMARLARRTRPDDHDELGAHIVRLLSARRFPAVEGEGGEPHTEHDGSNRRDGAAAGTAIDIGSAGEGRDCAQIIESLLELTRQAQAPDGREPPRPLRAVPATERARRVSARAETS